MREKKYITTNGYTWEVLGDDTRIMWVRKTDRSGHFGGEFIQFSYYPDQHRMCLDQGIKIHCDSIEEANFFVSKVLKVYWYDIPTEFTGRYHKLKKLQKLSN
jgi:hypothetical protein